jgi:signal transduction histidine kinase
MNYRQNLYLIFKEALHNALRHGQCREIELDVAVRGKRLDVTLRDDGRGFDPTQVGEEGDGLANMQRRAAAIGGRLVLESVPGGGTTVRFLGPLR